MPLTVEEQIELINQRLDEINNALANTVSAGDVNTFLANIVSELTELKKRVDFLEAVLKSQ